MNKSFKNQDGSFLYALRNNYQLSISQYLIKAFFLIALLMPTIAFSQSEKISINLKATSLEEVFNKIETLSGYAFIYDSNITDLDRKVNITAQDKSINAILSELFSGTDVEYTFNEKRVILKKKAVIAKSNGLVVRGRITSANGESLPSVNVIIKGTNIGVFADLDGNYSITIPDNIKDPVLRFAFMGYAEQEQMVGNKGEVNVALTDDVSRLDEVVVVGYGTVKRANLAGAVSTADAKVFASRPIQNAATGLQGEMPGLTVIRSSGAPGSSPTIRIRDVSSINGGSPLILIDGAEGDINLINSADIENISVLKDGTAAIYGARAADGVILITTKSASRNQKLKVSLDAFYSVKTPALLRKTASLYQHAAMALEITDGSFPIEYTVDELSLIAANSDKVLPTSDWGRWSGEAKFYKNQDWNDLMIGNGSLKNYNVSLSGGGDKYSYLISLGHQNEEGLPKFGIDNDKRYFVRAKSSIQVVKNLDYDLNLSYEASSRNYSSGISEGQNIWELIYKTRSWAPLRNPAGNFYVFEGFDNPAQVLEDGGESNLTTGNITVNNQLRWKVIEGLNVVGRAVVRKSDNDRNIVMKEIYNHNWDDKITRTKRTPNSAERNYSKTLSKNFTLYAEYKKTIAKHDIGVMVGGASESADYDKFSAKRIKFDQQETMSLQLGSSADQTAWSEGNAWTINSAFTRVNYAFDNKYLLEFTMRADGSSRFHPDHRWGYFPGVSGAWRVNEESFVKNTNLFDDLKVRASYGEMGNQSGIGLYDYIQLVSMVSNSDTKQQEYYPFGPATGPNKGQMATAGNIVSTARTWETIATSNLGLDFSILKNRLYGSVDYFWKENKNMLIPRTYPSMLGADAPSTNIGRLKIHGWEVALGWRDNIGELNYSIKGSLSNATNKVVERVGANLIELGLNKTPKDYAMSSYFGYEFDGIIQNEQELADYKARFTSGIPGNLTVGDAKYKDLDGDGKLTPALGDGTGDITYLGNTNPQYVFGFNLNLEYKGFDFGAFIQGVGRRTMFLEGEASKAFPAAWYQSAEYWYGKTWTANRTDAKYPAITNNSKRDYNYTMSSNTKHNVAYARLKNLQVGYTIPKKHLEKLSLEKIRIYFSGEDLFEIHNAPGGWDPEDGGGFVSYPFARNYSVGISVVF